MDRVCASDLQELYEILPSADEIIRNVAEFYRERDGVLLEGEALFFRTYRECEYLPQNPESEAQARKIVSGHYKDFLDDKKKTFPLYFPRCLIKGFIGK